MVLATGGNGFIGSHLVDALAARRVLGWSPEVDLDEGIRRTAAWMRTWFKD